MAHWKWDPSFSVGIEKIDTQHQKLIQYINELNIAFSYNKMYMVEEVLEKLVDYTVTHFSYEENLMKKAGYPKLEIHKQEHKSFVDRISFFQERYSNGENISKQLETELQLWLINHIQCNDADYKEDVQKYLMK